MIEYGWGIIIFGIAIALWLGWKIVRLIYLEIVFWMTHIQATKLVKTMQEAEPRGYCRDGLWYFVCLGCRIE